MTALGLEPNVDAISETTRTFLAAYRKDRTGGSRPIELVSTLDGAASVAEDESCTAIFAGGFFDRDELVRRCLREGGAHRPTCLEGSGRKPVHEDPAARGKERARDAAEHRALARAVRSPKGDALAGCERQVEGAYDFVIAEPSSEPRDLDHGAERLHRPLPRDSRQSFRAGSHHIRPRQKTGVSRHVPHTSRRASHISPIVT
jgi:hypothetical protein